jgi:hypothetical protein
MPCPDMTQHTNISYCTSIKQRTEMVPTIVVNEEGSNNWNSSILSSDSCHWIKVYYDDFTMFVTLLTYFVEEIIAWSGNGWDLGEVGKNELNIKIPVNKGKKSWPGSVFQWDLARSIQLDCSLKTCLSENKKAREELIVQWCPISENYKYKWNNIWTQPEKCSIKHQLDQN